MFINSTGYYIPEARIPNSYFTEINGLSDEWIEQRTGIKTRSRATEEETMEYMCSQAVKKALPSLPYNIKDVDLIIFASYSPSDTVATVGHIIQREHNIEGAKVFYVSSACSSAINAIEIIRAFFYSHMASKALMICAERNSTYSNDEDPVSGHLWGDAATAFFFSDMAFKDKEPQVLDIITEGMGQIGHGTKGVSLRPKDDGISMPYGKDVFIQACTYITQNTQDILDWNGFSIDDLTYFIGHQANMRILKNVSKQLNMSENKLLANIEELGNTGSASSVLVFAQNKDKFQQGDLICISVFGGGYSAGACLIKMMAAS